MKSLTKVFKIVLLLGLAKGSFSQKMESEPFRYGIELNNSVSFSSWTLTPTFSFRQWNQHSIDLGLGTNMADRWYWGPKPFTGIVFNSAYKFYPIGKDHKLNFYFNYNMKHYLFLSKLNGYSPDKFRHYHEHFLGYGFEVPLANRFYFNHDLGTGILINWTTFQTGGGSDPSIDFSVNIRIGFGYKFGQNK